MPHFVFKPNEFQTQRREIMISGIVSWISSFMYGNLLIVLLLLGGIYFTVRTRFVQFRMIRQAFRAIMEKPPEGDGKVRSRRQR